MITSLGYQTLRVGHRAVSQFAASVEGEGWAGPRIHCTVSPICISSFDQWEGREDACMQVSECGEAARATSRSRQRGLDLDRLYRIHTRASCESIHLVSDHPNAI